jgi:hypothetical protein
VRSGTGDVEGDGLYTRQGISLYQRRPQRAIATGSLAQAIPRQGIVAIAGRIDD